jgi:hypothetical protein
MIASTRSRVFGGALALLIGTIAALAPQETAQADAVGDVANVVDDINKLDPGGLGFTGDDLRGLDGVINQCQNAGDNDEVLNCAEAVSAELPDDDDQDLDHVNKMIHIYFDIEHKDYWSFVEDAGPEVACIAAQIITDGVPVCGIIGDILSAAKSVVSDAKAVIQFLEDVGAAAEKFLDGVGCFLGLGGCSSSAPTQLTPSQAVDGYYAQLQQQGLATREAPSNTGSVLGSPWQAWAGNGASSTIVTNGIGYAHLDAGLLKSKLPTYVFNVYALWDSDVIANYLPAASAFAQKYAPQPNMVQNFVALGLIYGKNTDLTTFDPSSASDLYPYIEPAQEACGGDYQKYTSKYGKVVSDWLLEPTAAKPQLQQIGPLPTNPSFVCSTFYNAVVAVLKNRLRAPMLNALVTPGKWGGAPPCMQNNAGSYVCGSAYVAHCNGVTSYFEGVKQCSAQGPGKGIFICPNASGGQPKFVSGTLTEMPKGCRLAPLSALPRGASPNQ